MLGDTSNVTLREQCYPEARVQGMTLFLRGYIGHITHHTWHYLLSRMAPPHSLTLHPNFVQDKNINPAYMALKAAFSILHLAPTQDCNFIIL